MALNATLSSQNGSFTNGTYLTSMSASPWMSPRAFELLVVFFFSFIIVTGLIGNGLVIATILRWKEMRSPCNIFLLNIAVADLCLTGIGGALRITELYHGWVFGEFLCRVLAPLQDVFVSVSGITHSTIAWERYRATVTPFKPRLSKSKAKRLLPVIWFLSYVACGLPLAITTNLRFAKGRVMCAPHWSVLYRRIYEVYLVVVFIVLQLVLQTYTYTNIIKTLRSKNDLFKNSSTCPGDRSNGSTNEVVSRMSAASNAREKKKSKTIKTLIVLVAVFQVCYIPRGAVMLISEFSRDLPPAYRYVVLVSLILYYLKHVLNPFILFMMSAEFKNAFKNMLLCKLKNRCTSKNSETLELQTIHAQSGNSGGKSSGKSDEGDGEGEGEGEEGKML